jgi:hypothetical protein
MEDRELQRCVCDVIAFAPARAIVRRVGTPVDTNRASAILLSNRRSRRAGGRDSGANWPGGDRKPKPMKTAFLLVVGAALALGACANQTASTNANTAAPPLNPQSGVVGAGGPGGGGSGPIKTIP